MTDNVKIIDEIPENFSSVEEAINFWDTHDTTDYLDNFETVTIETELQRRHFEIEIDEDLIPILSQKAQQKGMSARELVNHWLKEKLQEEID
jgi:predicted HicB family RNase H-like nuclease